MLNFAMHAFEKREFFDENEAKGSQGGVIKQGIIRVSGFCRKVDEIWRSPGISKNSLP
jgi:hypothetical protein